MQQNFLNEKFVLVLVLCASAIASCAKPDLQLKLLRPSVLPSFRSAALLSSNKLYFPRPKLFLMAGDEAEREREGLSIELV